MTGLLTWTFDVGNRAEGANLCAFTTLNTLGFVDIRLLILIETDGVARTDILTTMCDTAAAGLADLITADRAFITGDIYDLDNIPIRLISAH